MRTAAVINSLLDAADPLVIESRASLEVCSAVSVSSLNMCTTETLACPRLSYASPPKAQFVPNESCADLLKLVSRCFDICLVTCRKPFALSGLIFYSQGNMAVELVSLFARHWGIDRSAFLPHQPKR
ncbi:hypothetical protein G6F37_002488 [Rhizopus arrhizus]|nr:hypothetical protein G6F38_006992 [Rhizopus arrhizus]KAG1162085.1 hypothetical protein G6F37_002488 [Rhizopus arrhizus]